MYLIEMECDKFGRLFFNSSIHELLAKMIRAERVYNVYTRVL